MRGVLVAAGCLLLVGGSAVLVVADLERTRHIEDVRAQIVRVEERLDDSRSENLRLAETLTALRSQIAQQDAKLADTTGFLR